MANDAGAAYVDIEPEFRGFSQRLGTGILRESRGARALVDAIPNVTAAFSRDLGAQLARQRSQKVEVDAEVDTSGVVREVGETVRRAERQGPIRLDVAIAGAGGFGLGLLASAMRKAGGEGGFLAGVLGDLKFPILAASIGPAASAMAALGGAAAGLVGSLTPLVGLLPAVAVAAGALGQGVGVAAGAFVGIGGALKAYTQQQNAAATSAVSGANAAKTAARAQRSAAEQLRSALSDVDDAQRSNAEAAIAAAERVGDAERDLARSQESAKRAQDSLNDARREAKEELEDLQLAVERSALGEEQAQLRLEEARTRLRRVRVLDASSGGKASRELRDATLGVKDAELSVREAAERRGDEQERLNKLTKNGVDGSERVVSAQDGVRDANQRVVDSQRAVVAANASVAKAQEQGARRVESALANVERAQEAVADAAERANEATTSAAGGVDKFAQSMSGLSPAAQSMVRTLLSFEAPLKRLRDVAAENMFPGLERGLNALRPLFATFEPIVASTARVIGNLGQKAGEMMASPFFQRAFTTLGTANVGILESLGTAALNLAPPITQILLAAVPLAEAMAAVALRGSEMFATFIDGQAASGGLARFFEATEGSVRLLWGVLRPLVEVLFGIGRAAKETGDFILGGIGSALGELSDDINSVEGQAGLQEFFRSMWPAITEFGRLIVDLGRTFIDFARDSAPELAPLIKQVREELLPALVMVGERAPDILSDLITFVSRLAEAFSLMPVKPVLEAFSKLLDWFIVIAEHPIGAQMLQLASTLGLVRTAATLLGLAFGWPAALIAGAAILILMHWEKVEAFWPRLKNAVIEGFRIILDYTLGWAERFTGLAATAFGWVPGIGDDLKKAARAVAEFRDDANKYLNGIKDVVIDVHMRRVWADLERSGAVDDQYGEGAEKRAKAGYYGPAYHRGMDLGPVRGRMGQDVPILARAGEWVVTPEQMAELRSGSSGGSQGVVHNHEWNITAIPAGDLPTEIPRRLRAIEHLWG